MNMNMNMNSIAFFSLFIIAISQLVSSSPIIAHRENMNELIVYSPEIIAPAGGEVWQVGHTYNVNSPNDFLRDED